MEEVTTTPAAIAETQQPTFTDEQIATMTQWAQEDGWLPDESALIAEQEAKQVPDAFGGLIDPREYEFPIPPASLEPIDLAEQQAIRSAMAASGIPRELGNEMAKRWNTALMKPQDEAALQVGMKEAEAQLRQTYGIDADEILRLARNEAARIAKRVPSVKAMLEQTQLGNDVWLAATLANIARAKLGK
ncbi:MAG: hypothetical protein HYU78_00525 [Rhodocyclales bacterium]|nr:hypothetical protein [Rhodocyclales bacterium]